MVTIIGVTPADVAARRLGADAPDVTVALAFAALARRRSRSRSAPAAADHRSAERSPVDMRIGGGAIHATLRERRASQPSNGFQLVKSGPPISAIAPP